MLEAFQRANGQTLSGPGGRVIAATPTIGDQGAASNNRNQVGLTVGINHSF